MKNKLFSLSVLAAIGYAATLLTPAYATQNAASSSALTSQEREQAINEFLKDFRDNYVFPDVANRADDMIRKHLEAHDYDSASDGATFAKMVTDELREVCKDAHLHWSYSPNGLPDRKSAGTPTSAEIAQMKRMEKIGNGGYAKVERLPGNIGYVEIRGFASPEAAAAPARAAMEFLGNTFALIFDIRRNGGGDPASVQLLCNYLFDKRVHLNDIYMREGNQTSSFWTKPQREVKLSDKPIYVLTSKRTGSGAEEFAYDLQNLHRATIVGESTWGGANPGQMFKLSPHLSAFIPTGRAINPYTHTNWEGTGVKPDVEVPAADALLTAHKLAIKAVIDASKDDSDKAALQHALDDLSKN